MEQWNAYTCTTSKATLPKYSVPVKKLISNMIFFFSCNTIQCTAFPEGNHPAIHPTWVFKYPVILLFPKSNKWEHTNVSRQSQFCNVHNSLKSYPTMISCCFNLRDISVFVEFLVMGIWSIELVYFLSTRIK